MKNTSNSVAVLMRLLLANMLLLLTVATAKSQVTANFSASSVYPCAGETVAFTNLSTGAFNYIWLENGTPFSNAASPSRSYATAGSYLITMIASNGVVNDTANTIVVVNPALGASLAEMDASCFGFTDGSIDLTPVGGTANLAICMDGINDYLSADAVSTNNFSGGITVESWVKPEATWTSGDGMIAAFNSVGGGNHFFLSYNTTLQKFLYFDDVVGNQVPGAIHPRGQWYHIALTITSGNLGRLYVNGVLIRQFSTGTSWIPNGGQFSMGQEWDGSVTSQHFNGCMDEARIWNSALTQSTIQANYNNSCASIDPNHPNINSLVAYYSFNEGGGTFTFDRSGNNNHGVYNGILWSPPASNAFGCFSEGTGYAYDWSTNDITEDLGNLAAGTYAVDITDGAGCTFRDSVDVNEPPQIVFSLATSPSDTICEGDTTSILTSGAYTYSYSPSAGLSSTTGGSVQAFPSTTTAYQVVAEDGFGCQDSLSISITVNQLPTPVISGSDSICAGDSASLTATGGSQYAWNTGDQTSGISVALTADSTFTVTVTDANGCSADASQLVSVVQLPMLSLSGPAEICDGDSATLLVSGGGSPLWSTGDTTNAIQVGPAVTSSYSVALTNAFGCSSVDSIEVVVNALPIVSIGGDTVICAGDTASITATGGSTFLWNNAATTASIEVTPNASTTYSVVVTDTNICSASASISVQVNALPSLSILGADTLCGGDTTSLMASGAQSYVWNTGDTTDIIQVAPSNSTTYTVTGTDSNSCSASLSYSVAVNAAPMLVVAGDSNLCAGESTTLEVTGASSFVWSTSATGNTISVTPAATTTYTVTGTGSNGCVATTSITVTVNPRPMPVITNTAGVLSPGAGFASYQWYFNGSPITGATAQDYNPAISGNYSVEVTDSNGCTGTSSPITGTSELSFLNTAAIFPNPNTGRFTLEVQMDRSRELKVSVSTLHGQRIQEFEERAFAGRWQREIDLGAVAKGMYLVEIEAGGTRLVRKVMVD